MNLKAQKNKLSNPVVWNAHRAEIYLDLLIPSVLHYEKRRRAKKRERKKKFSLTGRRRDNRCKKGTDGTEKTQKTQGGISDAGPLLKARAAVLLKEQICQEECVTLQLEVLLHKSCTQAWNVLARADFVLGFNKTHTHFLVWAEAVTAWRTRRGGLSSGLFGL